MQKSQARGNKVLKMVALKRVKENEEDSTKIDTVKH